MIREEKPSFEPKIDINDTYRWLVVRGAKNNSRIKIQDGHFIIVPRVLNEFTKIMPFEIDKKEFDSYGYEKLKHYNDLEKNEQKQFDNKENFDQIRKAIVGNEAFIHKIIIDADSKEKILKQLASMGITKATIYPELSSYGEYIKAKYLK